jgi:hypothetical protein
VLAHHDHAIMRSPKKKATAAAKLRNWRVSILRNRAEYLGTVARFSATFREFPP